MVIKTGYHLLTATTETEKAQQKIAGRTICSGAGENLPGRRQIFIVQ